MPKELNHSRKSFINIRNTDGNERSKKCLITYLNSTGHHSGRIQKIDNDFARKLDFKDIKLPFKVRNIQQIEKKSCISISIFCYEIKDNTIRDMLIL